MINGLGNMASGMQAQEKKMNGIAHNLANSSTNGYKSSSVVFQDMGTGGVRLGAVKKDLSQGYLVETSTSPTNLDMAIQGEGFFPVQLPNGSTAYTRDGAFHLDGQTGQLVTSDGYALQPAVTLPQPISTITRIDMSPDGTLDYYTNDSSTPAGSANVPLARFANASGLRNIGQNLMVETGHSGAPVLGQPGTGGLGLIQPHALEGSNVNMTDEVLDMIITQRAYEINAKVIRADDDLLDETLNLKR
jgi:flagellar basal-body rod protein FlgG